MIDRLKTNRRKTAYHITRATKGSSGNIVAGVAVAAWLGAGLTFPTIALAQMPPDIAEKIAAIGRVVDPENTGKIYTPLQEKEPYAGVKVTRDVKYGNDARNVVDIFVPETGAAGRPVLMFVHGGGMIRGNKRPPGSAFHVIVASISAMKSQAERHNDNRGRASARASAIRARPQ